MQPLSRLLTRWMPKRYVKWRRLLSRKWAVMAVVLGSAPAGNAVLIVLAGPAAQAAGVHAGKLVGALAQQLGGGGGGRPDQAQAGGRNGSALPGAIASAPKLIAEAVGAS